jgi:hypothetical protein
MASGTTRGASKSSSSLDAKNLLEVKNAWQTFFRIFELTATLFQNFLLEQGRWSQKKRQNLFRKAAKLFQNPQDVV